MNKKDIFLELYSKWHSSFMFSAFGSADPNAKQGYENLKEWCLNNKEDALNIIKEVLSEEPSEIVRLLDDIWGKDFGVKVEGFMPLDTYCNLWLNILYGIDNKKGQVKIKDYYEEYTKWQNYLKNNYISWNPFKEDDPNVTLEEFKQGKRNK